MTQIRLLPIVIAAAAALLLLKGLGIVTSGGYVLVGTTAVEAAGETGHGGGGDAAAEGEAGMGAAPLLADPVMSDTSPVLDDTAPTLPLGPAEGADAGHGEPAAPAEGPEGSLEEAPLTAASDCLNKDAVEGTETSGHDEPADFDFLSAFQACPEVLVNEHGDALPTTADGSGDIVPLEFADASSEEAVLQRLSERREDLEAREAELDMRMALVEAAEKRIEERTATLEQLEARINAMVDEKRGLEEKQFVALVAMYETMKPKDAAAIFDELDLSVLLRVARAVNPRKMAPIMAQMDPLKAKDLTAALAVDQVEPAIDLGAEGLAALPQIVGQ